MRFHRSRIGRKLLRRSLMLETLETRRVLAYYFVNSSTGNDSSGLGTEDSPFATIGRAVAMARNTAEPDDVEIAPGTYRENVSIADAGGLTLHGDAHQRPVIVGTMPMNVIMPTAAFSFQNLVLQTTTAGATAFNVDTANRPNVRAGSVMLSNVDISAPSGLALRAPKLDQLSLVHVTTAGGAVYLEDINTASIDDLSVSGAASEGLIARWITKLDVDRLAVSGTTLRAVNLQNPYRSYSGYGTPPINTPSAATLTNVTLTGAGREGLWAFGVINLDVSNATVTGNGYGFNLSSIASAKLSKVNAAYNLTGVYVTGAVPIELNNVIATNNIDRGLYAYQPKNVTVVGGSFSDNGGDGIAISSSTGSVSVTSAVLNGNGRSGLLLTATIGPVNLTDVTANENVSTGLLASAGSSVTSPAHPDISIVRGRAEKNLARGIQLSEFKKVSVSDSTASGNKSMGLYVSNPQGDVELTGSTFSDNGFETTEQVHGATVQNAQAKVVVSSVTASGNIADGVNISGVAGNVTVDAVSASGNGASGVAVISSFQTMLSVSSSNLSSNTQNGLFASGPQGLDVRSSHFDDNGPQADAPIPYGNGIWALRIGTDNILVQDSTAIGTRVGVQTGAGMSFASLRGAAATVRRVTVSGTLVHPLTTTTNGAGIASTGTSPSLRVEDSVLNDNQLTDSRHARSVIFSTSPITVVNSQLLHNDGTGIDSWSSVTVAGTTVAGGSGGAAVKAVGGAIVNSTLSGQQQVGILTTGPLSITRSTITQNSGSSVVDNGSEGGGAYPVSIRNSILAGNAAQTPLFTSPAAVASSGYNLLGAMPAGWTGQNSDIVGSADEPIDPVLGPLTDNGGPTLTHMPLAGSPALEAGDPQLDGTKDQRGQLRPISAFGYAVALPDIGSVEADPVNVAPALSVDAESVSGTEGSTLTLTGTALDHDGNLVSVVADQGTVDLAADGTFQWSFAFTDDASFTVTLTATDSYGLTATTQFLVQVSNARPTVQLVDFQADPVTHVATLDLSVSDLGTADSHTLTVDWGDGTAETYPVDESGRARVAHAYASIGDVVISFYTTDDDQGTSDVQTIAARVPGVALQNGQLVVWGTSGDDAVEFHKRGRNAFDVVASFGNAPYLATFATSSVDSVFARLGGGNDQWHGDALAAPQTIFGESGDDWIVTGDGDDIAVGGAGDDQIDTGGGDDLVFGGQGRDVLHGGSGDDVLVAGQYERDDDLAALQVLQSAWAVNRPYHSRVERLRNGAGSDSDGVLVRLNIDSILDSDADELFGELGHDWFLTDGADGTPDIKKNESSN